MSKQNNSPKGTLYVQYNEHSRGGHCINPEDRWSSRTDKEITLNILGISLNKSSGGRAYSYSVDVDFIPKARQVVELVIVRYRTGDTFGSTSGSWVVVGIYDSPEEADAIAESIRNDTYDGPEKYTWTGYFERLEDVEVTTHRILP